MRRASERVKGAVTGKPRGHTNTRTGVDGKSGYSGGGGEAGKVGRSMAK